MRDWALAETWHHVKSVWPYLAIPVCLDALFFMFYGFVRAGLFSKVIQYLSATGINFISNGTITPELAKATIIVGLTAIALYVLYCIFQGSAWWVCQRLVGIKSDYLSYMMYFAKSSVLWAGLVFILSALSLAVYVRSTIAKQPMILANILLTMLLVIVAYFAFVGYSTKSGAKGSFAAGIKYFGRLAPQILLLVSALVVLYVIVEALSAYYLPSLIVQLLIVLPVFSIARMHFLNLRLPKVF